MAAVTGAAVGTMQAVVRHEYGGPEALCLEERPVPEPGPREVRVRVHASSVNPADRYHLLGTPRLVQLTDGFRRPKDPRLGIDVAGVVEAVGPAVDRFRVGDRLFGASGNGWAERAIVSVDRATHVPEGVSLDQAGVVSCAGVTALQGLQRAEVTSADRVLVNGASGGVGHYAVQLAKAMGAHVTGVCSTRNLDLVRDLGADEVIDYTTTDFTTLDRQWDVLVDNHGNHRPRAMRRALVDGGRWVMIGGPMTSPTWGPMRYVVASVVTTTFSRVRPIQFVASENVPDLETLAGHLASGAVRAHVDREFHLTDVAAAIDHLATNRTRGKLLVRVASAAADTD